MLGLLYFQELNELGNLELVQVDEVIFLVLLVDCLQVLRVS